MSISRDLEIVFTLRLATALNLSFPQSSSFLLYLNSSNWSTFKSLMLHESNLEPFDQVANSTAKKSPPRSFLKIDKKNSQRLHFDKFSYKKSFLGDRAFDQLLMQDSSFA